jgi:hypothetical protein
VERAKAKPAARVMEWSGGVEATAARRRRTRRGRGGPNWAGFVENGPGPSSYPFSLCSSSSSYGSAVFQFFEVHPAFFLMITYLM